MGWSSIRRKKKNTPKEIKNRFYIGVLNNPHITLEDFKKVQEPESSLLEIKEQIQSVRLHADDYYIGEQKTTALNKIKELIEEERIKKILDNRNGMSRH